MPIKLVNTKSQVCLFEQLKAGDSFTVAAWPNDVFIKTASKYKAVIAGGLSGEFNAFNAVCGNFAIFNGCQECRRVDATLTLDCQ
jgi:hypothetical protein